MPKPLADQLAELPSADREEIKGALPQETRVALNPQIYEASVLRGRKLAEAGVPAEDLGAYEAALEIVNAEDGAGTFDAEAAGTKPSPAPGAFGFSPDQIALANSANESFGQPAEALKTLTQQFGPADKVPLSFGNNGLHYGAKPVQPKPSAQFKSAGPVIKDRPDEPGSNKAELYDSIT